jgi:hypothetical protein
VGKTRLLEIFSAQSQAAGVRVGWGRAFELGGAPPFWPWLQALEAFADGADHAKAAIAAALDRLRPRRDLRIDAAEFERFEQFEGVRRALAAAAMQAPCLVVLEDVHAADPGTLLLAQFIERHLGQSRVLLLLTAREAATEAASAEVVALLDAIAAAGNTLNLPGLAVDDVGRLIEHLAGVPVTTSLSRSITTLTLGNPFYVTELVAAREEFGGLEALGGEEIRVPRGIRDLVRRQVQRLSDQAQSLLDAAAVIGRSTAIPLLARVCDLDEATVLELSAEVQAAGLAVLSASAPVELTFVHALVCEAISSALAPTARFATHARVAAALTQASVGGGDTADAAQLAPALAARHAILAAPLGPEHRTRAITLLRQAGAAAMRSLAYEEAVRHHADALRVHESAGGPVDVRIDLLLALAEAERAAGDKEAGAVYARAAELATTAKDQRRFARAALGCAATREFMTTDLGKLEMLERAAVDLGEGDDELHVRIWARLARDLAMDADSYPRRRDLSDRALAAARRLRDPEVLCAALDARLAALYGPANLDERRTLADEIAVQARAAGARDWTLASLAWKLSALLERGEIESSLPLALEHARLANELRLAGPRMNAASRLAALAFLRGRWEEGMEQAALAQRIGLDVGDRGAHLLYEAQLLLPSLLRGDGERLEAALLVLGSEGPRTHAHRMVRAVAALAMSWLGRREEAAQEFEALSGRGFADVGESFTRIGTLCLLAWLAHRLNDGARAAQLLPLLQPYAERCAWLGTSCALGPVARYLGLLQRTLGHAAAAEEQLRAAHRMAVAMEAAPWIGLIAAEIGPGHDRPVVAASDGEAGPREARLVRSGAVWLLSWAGNTAHLRAQRGLDILARLIAAAGGEIHAVVLAQSEAAGEPIAGAAASETGHELLDERAKAALKERLDDLADIEREAERCNDGARLERARRERAAIAQHLAASLGLGGRSRRSVDATERARVAVTVAVRRAVTAIARHAPEVGAHLQRSIRTGGFCRYEPEPHDPWRVTV